MGTFRCLYIAISAAGETDDRINVSTLLPPPVAQNFSFQGLTPAAPKPSNPWASPLAPARQHPNNLHNLPTSRRFTREVIADFAPEEPTPISYGLTLLFNGFGHGTVMGAITCGTPSCPAKDFTSGAVVSLMAIADADSSCIWSGCGYVIGNVCSVAMTLHKSVSLTFTPLPPLRISPVHV